LPGTPPVARGASPERPNGPASARPNDAAGLLPALSEPDTDPGHARPVGLHGRPGALLPARPHLWPQRLRHDPLDLQPVQVLLGAREARLGPPDAGRAAAHQGGRLRELRHAVRHGQRPASPAATVAAWRRSPGASEKRSVQSAVNREHRLRRRPAIRSARILGERCLAPGAACQAREGILPPIRRGMVALCAGRPPGAVSNGLSRRGPFRATTTRNAMAATPAAVIPLNQTHSSPSSASRSHCSWWASTHYACKGDGSGSSARGPAGGRACSASRDTGELCGACRFAELFAAPIVLCAASGSEHSGLILSATRAACRDFADLPPEHRPDSMEGQATAR
jgi:hypothetical protein